MPAAVLAFFDTAAWQRRQQSGMVTGVDSSMMTGIDAEDDGEDDVMGATNSRELLEFR